MKICRYENAGVVSYGVADPVHGVVREIEGSPFDGVILTGREFTRTGVTMLAPVTPTKIVAIGLNYKDHAFEMGKKIPDEPMLFLKPSSAVNRHGGDIVYPKASQRVDYEAELGVVIGKETRRVKASDARSHILGYTCVNDVTARDLQAKDVQYTRAKGFDTFAPIGPWVETDLDPLSLFVRCRVNGVLKQDGNTREMGADPFALVEFVSHVMTLYPGDVIATGTPPGVGAVHPGDVIEVEIEGIGVLSNRVVAQ
jgi:2-keto-4-pentenoate hydratase/2-oxohepta-3-ene-1,7-dioic acid hydratase in catechol pathway